jgi:hypothetical protein
MANGHHDDHLAGLERERAYTRLWRRVNEYANVSTVKRRAAVDWEADGSPGEAYAWMLTAEDVKERSPPRVREVPVESDAQAGQRPFPSNGFGHVKDASEGLGHLTEVCGLVQHRGSAIFDCASVQRGLEGRGEHDRSGLRVRVSQLTNEDFPGPVWEPEIEDHHIGSGKHAACLTQRRRFCHDLKVGIASELRSDRFANDRAVFHE